MGFGWFEGARVMGLPCDVRRVVYDYERVRKDMMEGYRAQMPDNMLVFSLSTWLPFHVRMSLISTKWDDIEW